MGPDILQFVIIVSLQYDKSYENGYLNTWRLIDWWLMGVGALLTW